MALLVAAIFAVAINVLPKPKLGAEGESDYAAFEAYCNDHAAGDAYSRIENVESLQLLAGR